MPEVLNLDCEAACKKGPAVSSGTDRPLSVYHRVATLFQGGEGLVATAGFVEGAGDQEQLLNVYEKPARQG